MSANMVTKQHIDTLVGAAIEIAHGHNSRMIYSWKGHFSRVVYAKTADQVGKMLWATNWAGLRHYYGDGHPAYTDWTEDVKGYVYHEPESLADSSIGGLIKAVRSYVYQACEHPHWETTEAKAFCDTLVDGLIEQLSEYQDAPWLIEEYEEIIEAREQAAKDATQAYLDEVRQDEALLIEQVNADRIAREANTLRGI
jgi:hypothetical protein